jgi:hypothetical protein
MEMIPVPSRIFKQISTWIMLLTGLGDAAHAFLSSLFDLHILTGSQLGAMNAGLVFVAVAAKLVQQNIALTQDQKDTLHEAVANAPVKADKTASAPTQPQTPST